MKGNFILSFFILSFSLNLISQNSVKFAIQDTNCYKSRFNYFEQRIRTTCFDEIRLLNDSCLIDKFFRNKKKFIVKYRKPKTDLWNYLMIVLNKNKIKLDKLSIIYNKNDMKLIFVKNYIIEIEGRKYNYGIYKISN